MPFERGNSLLVLANKNDMQRVKDVIAKLDVVQQQVREERHGLTTHGTQSRRNRPSLHRRPGENAMGDETMRVTFPGTRRGGLLLRGLLTVVFVAAAGMKFAAVPFEVAGFARFGYPLWFMYAVGAAQLVGAALLWAIAKTSPDSLRVSATGFDERFGAAAVRAALVGGEDPDSVIDRELPAVTAFRERIRKYLLYH